MSYRSGWRTKFHHRYHLVWAPGKGPLLAQNPAGVRTQRFWQHGCFSTTSGNITDDIIVRYLDQHPHKDGLSPSA
jgi:hypothetical protein